VSVRPSAAGTAGALSPRYFVKNEIPPVAPRKSLLYRQFLGMLNKTKNDTDGIIIYFLSLFNR
jgi:hypothetical protein